MDATMRATTWGILAGESTEIEEDCRSGTQPPSLLYGRAREAFEIDCRAPTEPFESDCRQPTLPLQMAAPGPGAYVHPPGAHVAPLPRGYHLVQSPQTTTGPAVLAPTAFGSWQRFRAPAALRDDMDRRLAALALLQPLGAAPALCTGLPDTLTAWLHVTNSCDLDCPTCYIGKSSARMSEETGRRAVAAVFANAVRHGFRAVKLKYAGGEASLQFGLIRRLHAYAEQLAAESGVGLRAVLLTNATHLRPTEADWLAQAGVKVMISLDGVGETHNQARPRRNRPGFDTFAAVAQTVDHILRPRGIRPDVNMVITSRNAHGAADVARWAILERALPTTFTFYRANLMSRGRAELQIEERALIEGLLAAYAALERELPTWPFTGGLLDRVSAEARTHACGVGQNYLVISHTGALAQCHMHLGRPVQSGLDGDLLSAVAAGPIHNLPVSQKEGCRDCAWRYRCAGGCPLETFRATGRWDVKSPHCHLYRALLPAALRLEGLRLMKVNGLLH